MIVRPHLPSCALLLALAACASHPPSCGASLTPINRQQASPHLGARPVIPPSTKAMHP
jgi:hypothetical protein